MPLTDYNGTTFVAFVDISGFKKMNRDKAYQALDDFYLSLKTTDIVSGGAWGRRPHTLSEPTMLVNNILE